MCDKIAHLQAKLWLSIFTEIKLHKCTYANSTKIKVCPSTLQAIIICFCTKLQEVWKITVCLVKLKVFVKSALTSAFQDNLVIIVFQNMGILSTWGLTHGHNLFISVSFLFPSKLHQLGIHEQFLWNVECHSNSNTTHRRQSSVSCIPICSYKKKEKYLVVRVWVQFIIPTPEKVKSEGIASIHTFWTLPSNDCVSLQSKWDGYTPHFTTQK